MFKELQQLYDAHELFNDYYFKGQLNTPEIIVDIEFFVDSIPVWGWYEGTTNKIGVTLNSVMYTTLLHEMIHQYQFEFNLIDKDHGTTFRKFTRFLEYDLQLEKGDI